MKVIIPIKELAGLLILFMLIACSSADENHLTQGTSLELLTVLPAGGSTDVPAGTVSIIMEFNQEILLADAYLVVINSQPISTISCKDKKLTIVVHTLPATSYTLVVGKGSIKTVPGVVSDVEYTTSFTTGTENGLPQPTDKTPEAETLLAYLMEIQGSQMLSGVMANVNWNLNEATWVYKHTGKWPAINGFDYLHFYTSTPGGWIDYENTDVAEKWWNDGGIVSAMWHWNVKANNGVDYTCTPGSQPDGQHTNFDIRKIDEKESPEYQQMIQDIDQVAGYLKLLKDKNIPILWRPLHEAAGNYYVEADWGTAWFWWGYHGPEYFKKLWYLMYDRFTRIHGLNNLIWIWTYEPEGYTEWYPGDDYVDMTGSDIYNQSNSNRLAQQYENMITHFDKKPAALAECGTVAKISEQWEDGARWCFFTTWYDYDRTKDMTAAEFNKKEHEHADIDWWIDAFKCSFVLSRDQLPSFR